MYVKYNYQLAIKDHLTSKASEANLLAADRFDPSGGDNMFTSDPYKNKATHAQLHQWLTKDSYLCLGGPTCPCC